MKVSLLVVVLAGLLLFGCDMFGTSTGRKKSAPTSTNAQATQSPNTYRQTQTAASTSQQRKVVRQTTPPQSPKEAGPKIKTGELLAPALAKTKPSVKLAEPTPKKNTPSRPSDPSSKVSIAYGPQGVPALTASFPWKQFERPSLQVQLITDPDVDVLSVKSIELDGPAVSELWKALVASINKPIHPASPELLRDSTNFIEYGSGQLLALCVQQNIHGRPAGFAVDRSGTRIVFYELDDWVDKNGAFYVAPTELGERSRFAEPGRLRVAFLSAEKPVWVTVVSWAGKTRKPAGGSVKPKPRNSENKASLKALEPDKKDTNQAVKKTEKGAIPVEPQPKRSPTQDLKSVEKKSAITPETTLSDDRTTRQKPLPLLPQTTNKTSSIDLKPVPIQRKSQPGASPSALVEPNLRDMSVEELAAYIEKRWKGQMSDKVRKAWVGGWYNYFKVNNPEPVRRDVFMSLLRRCYKLQPPGELRNAFATLYVKLKRKMKSEPKR